MASTSSLADASEFVYRRLRKYEPILLAICQAKWPDQNVTRVIMVSCINNKDARDAIELGGICF